jgi:hypothetical protein
VVRLPAAVAFSMHMLNLKPHVSLLDVDEGSTLDRTLERDEPLRSVHALLLSAAAVRGTRAGASA